MTGAKTGLERLTFTGCEASGQLCSSEGADGTASGQAGVIDTNLLDTRPLGPVAAGAGAEVWTELSSGEHAPYWAELGCGGSLFRLSGSLAGVQLGDLDVASPTSKTEFDTSDGEQALYTELSTSGGSSWTAPAVSSLLLTLANTSAPSTEIRP